MQSGPCVSVVSVEVNPCLGLAEEGGADVREALLEGEAEAGVEGVPADDLPLLRTQYHSSGAAMIVLVEAFLCRGGEGEEGCERGKRGRGGEMGGGEERRGVKTYHAAPLWPAVGPGGK